MSANPYRFEDGRIREPLPTSEPSMLFDLYSEVRRLEAEQPWQAGHTANTIVKYPDLRIVLVALKAGAQLLPHRTMGRISIQCLAGKIRVHLPERSIEVAAGKLLTLDSEVSHDITAISDSSFLLTIAWPRPEPRANVAAPRFRVAADMARAPRYFAQPTSVVRIDYPRVRELGLDQTLADTFPCSDPLSSIPNPLTKG